MYIRAIVHCFTEHALEFTANGLVGDIQTLNCNELNSWGFSTDLQTDFTQKSKTMKSRLQSEAGIEFTGKSERRVLNVPLNPCSTENLFSSNLGALLHYFFTFA